MGNSIIDILGLKTLEGFHDSGSAWLAQRRPDVAPMAYDIRVHKPPQIDDLDQIVSFGSPADERCIRQLYSQCNGLHVGGSRLAVYGIIGSLESNFRKRQTPFDINIPNVHERPKTWPKEPLIVAVSRTKSKEGNYQKFFHSILPTGKLNVAHAEDFEAVSREYEDCVQWLTKEFQLAISITEFF